MTKANTLAVKEANDSGLTINLSADSIAQADKYKSLGVAPVVVVVRSDQKKAFRTPGGNTVAICPATISDITCLDCQICANKDRKAIIGFPAHGFNKKRLDKALNT